MGWRAQLTAIGLHADHDPIQRTVLSRELARLRAEGWARVEGGRLLIS